MEFLGTRAIQHDVVTIILTYKLRFDIGCASVRTFLSSLVKILGWVAIVIGEVTFSTWSLPSSARYATSRRFADMKHAGGRPAIQSLEQQEISQVHFFGEAARKEYPCLSANSCESNLIF